jgi:hypothetical protein
MSTKSRIVYNRKFFTSIENAKVYVKSHGGVIYTNMKYSHSKNNYLTEAAMSSYPAEYLDTHPVVVAWNEFVKV